MTTTYTKDSALILPDETVQKLVDTLNADIAHIEGLDQTQAIAGAALTLWQAIYLAPYTLGAITSTPAASGGSLADGTYKARVAANIPFGPNIASIGQSTFSKFLATLEVTFTISGGGGAGSCLLSWGGVNGAVPDGSGVTYQVWITPVGGASGTENYFFTTTGTSFTVTSTSSGGTSGTMPVAKMPMQWLPATDSVPGAPDQIYICVVAGASGTVCYGKQLGVVTNPAWNFDSTISPIPFVYVPSTAGPLTTTAPRAVYSTPIGLAIAPTQLMLMCGPLGAGALLLKELTSSNTGFLVPAFYSGAGAPTQTTLATGSYNVGDLYYDTTGNVLYICKTAGACVNGTSNTSVWQSVGGSGASGVSSVSTTDHAMTFSPTTGAVVGSLTKTSDIAGQKLIAFYSGAGAPSNSTLAAGTYNPGDLYYDTTNDLAYVCKTSGSNSTSVWVGI